MEYPNGIGRCILGKAALERHQVWIYLGAVCIGLLFGTFFANQAAALEWLLWPSLGLLLFATFTQVPLIHLAAAFRDRQFISAVLAGNFTAIPLLVWGLLAFVPADPAIKLDVLLVLLVPCTDWYLGRTAELDALRRADDRTVHQDRVARHGIQQRVGDVRSGEPHLLGR